MAKKICDPERMTQSAYEDCLELRRMRRKVEDQIATRLDAGFSQMEEDEIDVEEDES